MALLLLSGAVPFKPITDLVGTFSLTAFADGYHSNWINVSTGYATEYWIQENHFYRVDWTNIDPAKVKNYVRLNIWTAYGKINLNTNAEGDYTDIPLYAVNSYDPWSYWDVLGLKAGESSSGSCNKTYVVSGGKPKVCTFTCLETKEPTWRWSEEMNSCKVTFTCVEKNSLTTTLDATVSFWPEYAATVTFNSKEYKITPTSKITYELNGGTMEASNPATYDAYDGVASFADPSRPGYSFGGWYDNAEFTGSPVTSIPRLSGGDRTLYAKWIIHRHTVTLPEHMEFVPDTETGEFDYDSTVSFKAETGWAASDSRVNVAFVALMPEGKCGDNADWKLIDSNNDGLTDKLLISGTGDMYDYDQSANKAPWYDFRDEIPAVEIAEGINDEEHTVYGTLTTLTA